MFLKAYKEMMTSKDTILTNLSTA